MNSIVRCPRTGRACSEGACRERHWCRQLFERGLSHRGLPLKRKFRPRCCAKTRAGAPCIMRVVPGKRRCRFHGPCIDSGRCPLLLSPILTPRNICRHSRHSFDRLTGDSQDHHGSLDSALRKQPGEVGTAPSRRTAQYRGGAASRSWRAPPETPGPAAPFASFDAPSGQGRCVKKESRLLLIDASQ